MTRFRPLPLLALCAAALLALPGAAAAKPGPRGMHATFPHASRLCAAAANDRLPKRLASSQATLSVSCATLESSYMTARADLRTAIAPLRSQARDAVAAARSACATARAAGDRAGCREARTQVRSTLRGLGMQARTALKAYRSSIGAARTTFWSSVRALRGGSAVTADPRPVPGSDPSTDLPQLPAEN